VFGWRVVAGHGWVHAARHARGPLAGEHGIGQDSTAGRQESEWATRRRSDPGKLAIAARLRSETTLPIKWIAARVQIGTAKGPSPCSLIWLRAKTNAKPQAPSNPAPSSNSNLRFDPFPLFLRSEGRHSEVEDLAFL